MLQFTLETEPETDGRWLAEVLALPGVLAYGATQKAALDQDRAHPYKARRPRRQNHAVPHQRTFARA